MSSEQFPSSSEHDQAPPTRRGTNTSGSVLIQLAQLGPDDHWQEQANCLGVDPELFFPERGASSREAKDVCRGCIVRTARIEYALANGEKFGIWGGLSEKQRKKLRKQRAQANRRTQV